MAGWRARPPRGRPRAALASKPPDLLLLVISSFLAAARVAGPGVCCSGARLAVMRPRVVLGRRVFGGAGAGQVWPSPDPSASSGCGLTLQGTCTGCSCSSQDGVAVWGLVPGGSCRWASVEVPGISRRPAQPPHKGTAVAAPRSCSCLFGCWASGALTNAMPIVVWPRQTWRVYSCDYWRTPSISALSSPCLSVLSSYALV